MNKTDWIPEQLAVRLVMSSDNFTNHDQSELDFVSARIKITKYLRGVEKRGIRPQRNYLIIFFKLFLNCMAYLRIAYLRI